MRTSKLIIVFVAIAAVFIFSCKKDSNDLLKNAEPSETTNKKSGGGIGLRSNDELDGQLIVLGQQRNNPYSVANMTTAWNNLYSPDVTTLPATHLYVRFLPQDLEDLKTLYELEETQDLDFDDYPLDYEIVEDGDRYHDPSIPEEDITWQYTVVRPNFTFPDIQHEVLEELVLAPYFSLLTAEAFRITGNPYNYEEWPGNGSSMVFCEPGCPNFPCCLVETLPCNPPPSCSNPPPPCSPGNPGWPDCLDQDGGEVGSVETNDCGCTVPINTHRPAGCVRVVDTQLGNEGVRHVKVIVKDSWFSRVATETDDNGCWKVNESHSGKIKVKIKFMNDKCKIRAIRGWGISSIPEYSQILTHKFSRDGAPYNNIPVLYANSTGEESNTRARWYAATGNNALFEYHEFAAADGISPPPDNLQVLLTTADEGEAAPMLAKSSGSVADFLTGANGIYAALTIIGVYLDPSEFPTYLFMANFLGLYLTIWAPDIVYNHGGEGLLQSDRVKDSFYHEYAHSSHWNELNDDDYWLDNVGYIVVNNGYGDGTASGAGRTAVIEMWGYTIGTIYADRRYGLNHSYALPTDLPAFKEENRHINKLEFLRLREGFIPAGLCNDLVDDNTICPGCENGLVTNDDVFGYTYSNILSNMDSDVLSPIDLRQKLKSSLPSGITNTDIDDLFSDYGY